MSLTKEVKLEIVEKHGRGPADTGSAEVQVALLTRRINDLTEHLRTHDLSPLKSLRWNRYQGKWLVFCSVRECQQQHRVRERALASHITPESRILRSSSSTRR